MGQIAQKMKDDRELHGFAQTTQKEYLQRARNFVAHYGRSPTKLGESEIRAFLLHLVNEKHAGPATHHMYVAAIKFLYATTLERPEEVDHDTRERGHPTRRGPAARAGMFAAAPWERTVDRQRGVMPAAAKMLCSRESTRRPSWPMIPCFAGSSSIPPSSLESRSSAACASPSSWS